MVGLAEQAGPGTLVHPTFGSIEAEIIEFDGEESWEEGRVWRFRAEFLEPVARGLQLQPASAADTGKAVEDAADGAEAASKGSFLDQVGAGLGQGVRAVQKAAAAVRPYVAAATRLVGDASRVFGLVRGIAGQFGRYGSGKGAAVQGIQGALTTARQVQGAVNNAINTASTARSLVLRTGADLSALVSL